MNFADKAVAIIVEAERKIQGLASEALSKRDYQAVQRLSAMAECIAATAKEQLQVATVQDPSPALDNGPNEEHRGTWQRSQGQNTPTAVISTTKAAPFPRFYRDANQLVKVGYSKSDRRTYEHRSPRDVLDRLVAIASELGAGGRRFTSERILPPEETRLSDVPSYQVYLCLAFLVRSGFVRRIGRLGYVINEDATPDVGTAVDAAYKSLPER